MDIEKAIEQLKDLKIYCLKHVRGKADSWNHDVLSLDLAIKILEKDIPKKPIERVSNLVADGSGSFICPVCDEEIGHFTPKDDFWRYVKQDKYCKECSQKIGWD